MFYAIIIHALATRPRARIFHKTLGLMLYLLHKVGECVKVVVKVVTCLNIFLSFLMSLTRFSSGVASLSVAVSVCVSNSLAEVSICGGGKCRPLLYDTAARPRPLPRPLPTGLGLAE